MTLGYVYRQLGYGGLPFDATRRRNGVLIVTDRWLCGYGSRDGPWRADFETCMLDYWYRPVVP